MQRLFVWIMSLCLVVGISALLNGYHFGAPSSGVSGDPISLTFWTMQLSAFDSILKPMFQQFESDHPGVHIQWVDVPFTEMEKRVLTGLLGDDPPDVINLNPAFSALLASRHVLVDMRQAVSPNVQQSYLPVAWQAVSLPSVYGGMTYGLPWYLTTSLTFWNTRLLPSMSALPNNWSGLMALGPQVVKQTPGTFVSFPAVAEHGALTRWLNKQGVQLCSPLAPQWLTLLQTGLQQGYLPQAIITDGHRTAQERFMNGKLLMLTAGSSLLGTLQKNTPALLPYVQITPQFGQDAHSVDMAIMLVAVPVKAPHRSLAVNFATFITNQLNQLSFARQAPVLPSNQEALLNLPSRLPSDTDLTIKARRLSRLQLFAARQTFQVSPNQPQLDDQTDALAQQVLLRQLTPSETAKQLCKLISY